MVFCNKPKNFCLEFFSKDQPLAALSFSFAFLSSILLICFFSFFLFVVIGHRLLHINYYLIKMIKINKMQNESLLTSTPWFLDLHILAIKERVTLIVGSKYILVLVRFDNISLLCLYATTKFLVGHYIVPSGKLSPYAWVQC